VIRRTRIFFDTVALLTARRPAWLLCVAVLAACGSSQPLLLTGVPETQALLSYQLPTDSAALRAVLNTALDQTVCLVRSGRADECQEALDTPGCDSRSAAEVRALYTAAFDSIPAVTMAGPAQMNAQLRGVFPAGSPDVPIQDARRGRPCLDWNQADGTCAAIRYREIWMLFRGPNDARRLPATLEVFLAYLPCRGAER
jgi:hypothetical protein